MKKLLIPLMFVAILVGLFEQSKDKPNICILCAAVAVFMFGMMNLSSKIPSKTQREEAKKKEEDAE
jgi:predicted branched-subunit amino acid permease